MGIDGLSGINENIDGTFYKELLDQFFESKIHPLSEKIHETFALSAIKNCLKGKKSELYEKLHSMDPLSSRWIVSMLFFLGYFTLEDVQMSGISFTYRDNKVADNEQVNKIMDEITKALQNLSPSDIATIKQGITKAVFELTSQ